MLLRSICVNNCDFIRIVLLFLFVRLPTDMNCYYGWNSILTNQCLAIDLWYFTVFSPRLCVHLGRSSILQEMACRHWHQAIPWNWTSDDLLIQGKTIKCVNIWKNMHLIFTATSRAGVKYVFVFANTNTAYLYLNESRFAYLYLYLILRIWCIWQIRYQIQSIFC